MRNLFIIYILLSSCITSKHTQVYTIQGKVTHSYDWCAGMAPGKEHYDQMMNPPACVGLKLYIKKGNTNNITSPVIKNIITDSSGQFNIQLPKGNYIILQENQLSNIIIPQDNETSKWDKSCLISQWEKGTYLFEVKDSVNKFKFNIHTYCGWNTPCLQYSGPLPP